VIDIWIIIKRAIIKKGRLQTERSERDRTASDCERIILIKVVSKTLFFVTSSLILRWAPISKGSIY
jgi:hypothetical protein